MVTIPVVDYPSYVQEIVLDGVSYNVRLAWNDRGEYWAFSLFNLSLEALVTGIKVVINYALTTDLNRESLPPGEFYAIDNSGEVDAISYEDLINGVVELVYIPESEVEFLAAGGDVAAL